MASQLNEINDLIAEIRVKTERGLPVKPYDENPDNISFALKHEISRAQDKLNSFFYEFSTYNSFIEEKTLEEIASSLNKILSNINTLIDLPISDTQQAVKYRGELLREITNLPVVFNLHLYNTGNINIAALKTLILRINSTFDLFSDLNIDSILSDANFIELNDIINCIVAIHNEYIVNPESPFFPKLTIEAYKVLKLVSDKSKKIELNDSIEKLEDKTIIMKQKIDLSGNSNLFDAFKNEADSFNWKIISYNTAILLILISVLTSLSLLIFIMIFTPDFKFIKDYHFYGFYISFFFFLSILLAYLIKERSRLISHQYYCKITYLELLAMVPFTTQIQDSIKIDDLKIRLAERYFLGPNRMQNSSDPTSSVTTSKLSEVIKLAQEVKSTIK
ncbi:hypothetical protein OFM92_05840 [Acinetobacter baumannii]|nr:hypothetical protein [Acinetobacter baumannii]